ncbi:MAG: DNA (cytosine-5-)-methyltransferase, partial [Phyllobacteriaceae bacterium]|nr:DNA (cytosine-5-)-methyltransferase [Phyllobacteriaceae bacterium]
LARFLRHPGKPLSLRATRGFLSRLDRTELRLPVGFRDRVAAHLAGLTGAPRAAAE